MEAIEVWAGDWADQFDQGWTDESLAEWVGKRVKVRTPDGVEPARGVEATIVGFSKDTIILNGNSVFRFSFITDQGAQVALFDQMQVEETEE
jgi:ribosome maturation factor RimP